MRPAALLVLAAACSSSHGTVAPEAGVPRDAAADSTGDDRVVTSFVFFGGCRVSKSDLDPVNNPSSANLPQLQQTLADLAALPEPPKYWFFVGDLVDGLVDGSADLTTQLDAWASIYYATPVAAKLSLVPVAGNHEMLTKDKINGTKIEISNVAADAAWTTWVTSHGFATHAGNGPTAGAADLDALQDDQSRLTYSFDDGGNHFIVMNTDTWTTTPDPASGDTQVGWVPLHWLTADLAAAQANPAITGIYLFGHKPLVSPTGLTDGTEAVNPALAPALMQALDGSPKVKGYFTSHSHQWVMSVLPGARGVPQLIAGNGGTAPESDWADPYFGFTLVKIYASGKLGAVSYHRPVPTPYNAPVTTPAVPDPEVPVGP